MQVSAGVIGLQGDVTEHATAIEAAGETHGHEVSVETVRESGIVPDCDILALPGGESTTISRLLRREGIAPEVFDHVRAGKPLLATCAGLIVASSDAQDDRVDPLGVLDVTVERNAFGRQRDSFEAAIDIQGLDHPFPGVFIRAPAVAEVGDGATILARHDGVPVAVTQGPVTGTAFHPELTGDHRLHKLAFFDR